jgi:hypothetical protein
MNPMDDTLLTKAVKVWMAETMYSAKKAWKATSHFKKAKNDAIKAKMELSNKQQHPAIHD